MNRILTIASAALAALSVRAQEYPNPPPPVDSVLIAELNADVASDPGGVQQFVTLTTGQGMFTWQIAESQALLFDQIGLITVSDSPPSIPEPAEYGAVLGGVALAVSLAVRSRRRRA